MLRCERSRLHDLRGVSSACTPDFVANSHAPVPTMSATDGPATGTTAPVDVDNPETDLPAAEGPVAAGAADGTHTTAVPAVVAAHPPRGPASDPYAPDGPAPPTLPQAASVEAPSTPLVADAGADDGRVPRDVDAVKLFVGQVRHAPRWFGQLVYGCYAPELVATAPLPSLQSLVALWRLLSASMCGMCSVPRADVWRVASCGRSRALLTRSNCVNFLEALDPFTSSLSFVIEPRVHIAVRPPSAALLQCATAEHR